ncbi:hypothetical protein [Herbaspirillum sp. YR522]|uniref:hypothetical protein n=1 Tax=Herbaspirillum sp. YR522 TaxID=1144342 RepID=UPI00026F87FC|nr:hypothetical protein [Herbaspirillum sp. YR522]EJN09096.1 hypothetical protein PMI40_00921 [Herbaspirillum sp. YR522]
MYIIAIAWLYVVFMMSITEQSAVAGVATFLLYGVFPLTIVLYLMGTPQRKRNRQRMAKTRAAPKEKPADTAVGKCESNIDESAVEVRSCDLSTMVRKPGEQSPPN